MGVSNLFLGGRKLLSVGFYLFVGFCRFFKAPWDLRAFFGLFDILDPKGSLEMTTEASCDCELLEDEEVDDAPKTT